MKKQFNRIKYRLSKVLRTHQGFVVIVVVLTLLIVAVLRLNMLGNIPVDQTYLDQQSSQIKSVKFNQDAISQIEDLQDSNVADLGTRLPANRENPFNE